MYNIAVKHNALLLQKARVGKLPMCLPMCEKRYAGRLSASGAHRTLVNMLHCFKTQICTGAVAQSNYNPSANLTSRPDCVAFESRGQVRLRIS